MNPVSQPATYSNHQTRSLQVALAGNPNCGKTTIFNALTGLRHKVGNYPGVTVEKKEGRISTSEGDILILDLPGTYSLSPKSADEEITRDVLLGRRDDTRTPDLILVVVDASNLERNLYLATQIIELGTSVILLLNMMDIAHNKGCTINAQALEKQLGVTVIPTVASEKKGIKEIKSALASHLARKNSAPGVYQVKDRTWKMPSLLEQEVAEMEDLLKKHTRIPSHRAFSEALLLLTKDNPSPGDVPEQNQEVWQHLLKDRERFATAGLDAGSAAIDARYQWLQELSQICVSSSSEPHESISDKLDKVLTHKWWGFAVFLSLMTLMFVTIFFVAETPMGWIEDFFGRIGEAVASRMPEGALQSLIVDGAIAGVAGVLVFLPQICILFLFLGLLEDSGYMARAAFIMDRLMNKVGLHGKSFIPLLSSFACAIPGIMAARTIESKKDRLVTMLVAPLMSCSARLPVYYLMLAILIPNREAGPWAKAFILLGLYLLGILAAMGMAFIFKKTLLRGETPLFLMELPPYKRPNLKTVLLHMWERASMFIRRAGTIILGISIILWFLLNYPKDQQAIAKAESAIQAVETEMADAPEEERSARITEIENERQAAILENSVAGKLGHFIEPSIRPLGYDWKIGIGLISAFAAREVFVGTMGVIYSVGNVDENDQQLRESMLADQNPHTGRPLFTPLVGVSILVFFVLAMQCVSTVAVMKRETNGWKWPLFQLGYMTALAYGAALIVYQGGLLMGF